MTVNTITKINTWLVTLNVVVLIVHVWIIYNKLDALAEQIAALK